ncbi:hypothetical protein CFP56_002975 [Quercus suber]
MSVWIAT